MSEAQEIGGFATSGLAAAGDGRSPGSKRLDSGVWLACPVCGRKRSKVMSTTTTVRKAGVHRRRECLGCGARFSTFEAMIQEASFTYEI